MKKVLYTLAGMAMIALGAVSCQKETSFEAGKDGSVTFTVNLPGVETKAISDGTTATKLDFAIYDGDGKYLKELSESATVSTFSGKKATVTVQVIKDLTYQFVFFAEAETGSPYTFAPADTKLSIDYGAANLEAADAFYYATEPITVEGAFSRDITLTRPLAQINFGSSKSDIAAAKLSKIDVDGLESSLVLTNVYSQMNLLTGKLTGEPTATVPLTEAAKPAEALKVKDVEYGWIAMAYILAGDKEVTDLTLGVKTTADGNAVTITRKVANVPYQRNHRTNILGNIFSYTASFNIEIDSNFEEPDYDITPWDGTRNENLDVNVDPIHITNGQDLAQIAYLVNNGTPLAGKTLILDNDINLNNLPWTPIGTNGDHAGFQGIFDGNGKTISNLFIDQTKTPAYQAAGLFGSFRTGTIKNFTVENATVKNITTGDPNDNGAAVVVGSAQFPATIENVTVKNAYVSSNCYVGGIAGYFSGSITGCTVDGIELKAVPAGKDGDKVGGLVGHTNTKGTYTNNTVNDFTITAYRDFGGLAGTFYFAAGTLSGNKVTNGKLIVSDENSYSGHAAGENVAKIVGRPFNGTVSADNTEENVVILTRVAEGVNLNNGTYYVTHGDGVIAAAIANAKASDVNPINIVLEAGSYPEVADVTGGQTFNIAAAEGLTADDVEIGGINHSSNGTPSTVNVKNVSINNALQTSGWFTGTSPKINPCVGAWGGSFDFNGCTFKVSGNSNAETGIMTWWVTSTVTFKFSNCLFTDCGDAYKPSSSRAMQIYGDVNMTVNNCVFNTKKDYTLKYVAKAGNKATFSDCEVNNSVNFVQLGSSAYPGNGYAIEINNTTLGDGVNYYLVDNEENQSVTIDGEVKK